MSSSTKGSASRSSASATTPPAARSRPRADGNSHSDQVDAALAPAAQQRQQHTLGGIALAAVLRAGVVHQQVAAGAHQHIHPAPGLLVLQQIPARTGAATAQAGQIQIRDHAHHRRPLRLVFAPPQALADGTLMVNLTTRNEILAVNGRTLL